MNYHAKPLAALAAILALAACAEPIETKPVSQALAPMPERTAVPGDTLLWQVGDEQRSWTVTKVASGMITTEGSDGCSWTSESQIAPSAIWSSCAPFDDGTMTFTKTGEIFPLEVGKSMAFAVSGSNVAGNSWENTRNCSVEGTAQVSVPAGTFDTYQMVCDDGSTRRTYFMSPDTGTPVLYERYRRRNNETSLYRLISFTPGQASS